MNSKKIETSLRRYVEINALLIEESFFQEILQLKYKHVEIFTKWRDDIKIRTKFYSNESSVFPDKPFIDKFLVLMDEERLMEKRIKDVCDNGDKEVLLKQVKVDFQRLSNRLLKQDTILNELAMEYAGKRLFS